MGLTTRFSKLPPVGAGDRGRHVLGVAYDVRRPLRRERARAAARAGGDRDAGAVVERDRHGAACAAAVDSVAVDVTVPPSATLGVAVRLTVVVSIVSVIGDRRRVAVDSAGSRSCRRSALPIVRRIAAGVDIDVLVAPCTAQRHSAAAGPAAMVMTAPLSSVTVTGLVRGWSAWRCTMMRAAFGHARRRLRLTVVVSMVSVIVGCRRRGVDHEVLEVAAGGGADDALTVLGRPGTTSLAAAHAVVSCRWSGPAAIVMHGAVVERDLTACP